MKKTGVLLDPGTYCYFLQCTVGILKYLLRVSLDDRANYSNSGFYFVLFCSFLVFVFDLFVSLFALVCRPHFIHLLFCFYLSNFP